MTDMSLHAQGCSCCADLLAKRFDRRRFLHVAAGAGLMAAFPPLAFAAEGKYDAMLLTCIDPRFPEPTIKYMKATETATHKAALMEFKKQVGEKQPKLAVELHLMAPDGSVDTFS